MTVFNPSKPHHFEKEALGAKRPTQTFAESKVLGLENRHKWIEKMK